jgi:hypothetical protein
VSQSYTPIKPDSMEISEEEFTRLIGASTNGRFVNVTFGSHVVMPLTVGNQWAADLVKELRLNATVIHNLEVAISIIEEAPADKFDLTHFAEHTDCGTIACSLGTLAMQPYFQAQGLALCEGGTMYSNRLGCRLNGRNVLYSEELNDMFGEDAFKRLFHARYSGICDMDILKSCTGDDADDKISDKQLALKRLTRQLAIYNEKV